MGAQNRSQVVELLARHGVDPVKRLGQNFLVDANITRRIVVESGVGPGDRVVEVGPGTGTLTAALVDSGAKVSAIELDRRLAPVLGEALDGLGVELIWADAVSVDWAAVTAGEPWTLVANLPYNVGTRLVMDILMSEPMCSRLVVMVQREVADRLTATVGTSEYGLATVVAGIYGRTRFGFRVPAQVFYPVPRVESAVVVIDRVEAPVHADRAVELARAGFSQRRKMLRSSLASVVVAPTQLLDRGGFDPQARAETLSPEDFLALASLEAVDDLGAGRKGDS